MVETWMVEKGKEERHECTIFILVMQHPCGSPSRQPVAQSPVSASPHYYWVAKMLEYSIAVVVGSFWFGSGTAKKIEP